MSEAKEESAGGQSRVLIGLILGAVCGIAVNMITHDTPPAPATVVGSVMGGPMAQSMLVQHPPYPAWLNWTITYVMDPVGQVFLRLLILTVIPLVFASLAVGVAKLGDLRKLGRVGVKTFGYFIATTGFAVVIGLTLVQIVAPGKGLSQETRMSLEETFQRDAKSKLEKPAEFGVNTFVNIIPRNPLQAAVNMDMLAVIFVALLVGIGLSRIDPGRAGRAIDLLETVGDLMVFIIQLAMKFAPLGVFALIFQTTSKFGFDLLKPLGMYVLVVLVGLAVQMFIVYPILLMTLVRISPVYFYKKIWNVVVTAFSTSSSSATLPTSIRTAEQGLGVPRPLAGFVLPLGATMNMNGTALFEGVTVVFLAQVFGKDLTLMQQFIVVVMSVMTAVGAAGVPGGSIPLLSIVLATVGVPPEAIAIILGVDRLLDMCRTTLNVVGDLTATVFVAKSEGQLPSPSETRT